MKHDHNKFLSLTFSKEAEIRQNYPLLFEPSDPSFGAERFWKDLTNAAERFKEQAKEVVRHFGIESDEAAGARVVIARSKALQALARSKCEIGDWEATPLETALIDTYKDECRTFLLSYESIIRNNIPPDAYIG